MRIHHPNGTVEEVTITPSPITQILQSRGINPNEVIVAKNGVFVPEDSVVRDSDNLRIYRIAHGG
jgi:sulfur carrier protein ThiS